jgi:hypothetical protein
VLRKTRPPGALHVGVQVRWNLDAGESVPALVRHVRRVRGTMYRLLAAAAVVSARCTPPRYTHDFARGSPSVDAAGSATLYRWPMSVTTDTEQQSRISLRRR